MLHLIHFTYILLNSFSLGGFTKLEYPMRRPTTCQDFKYNKKEYNNNQYFSNYLISSGSRSSPSWSLMARFCSLCSSWSPQHACKILFRSPLISSGSLVHSWLWLIQQSFHPWDHCHSQFFYKFSFSHCEYTDKTFLFRLNELAKRAYVISLMSFWIELLFQGLQLPQVSLSLLYVSPALLVYLQWTPQTSFRWAYWLYWI